MSPASPALAGRFFTNAPPGDMCADLSHPFSSIITCGYLEETTNGREEGMMHWVKVSPPSFGKTLFRLLTLEFGPTSP